MLTMFINIKKIPHPRIISTNRDTHIMCVFVCVCFPMHIPGNLYVCVEMVPSIKGYLKSEPQTESESAKYTFLFGFSNIVFTENQDN